MRRTCSVTDSAHRICHLFRRLSPVFAIMRTRHTILQTFQRVRTVRADISRIGRNLGVYGRDVCRSIIAELKCLQNLSTPNVFGNRFAQIPRLWKPDRRFPVSSIAKRVFVSTNVGIRRFGYPQRWVDGVDGRLGDEERQPKTLGGRGGRVGWEVGWGGRVGWEVGWGGRVVGWVDRRLVQAEELG